MDRSNLGTKFYTEKLTKQKNNYCFVGLKTQNESLHMRMHWPRETMSNLNPSDKKCVTFQCPEDSKIELYYLF